MTDFKKGGPLQNSNIFATNRLFVKNKLFKKRKKKRAPGVYNPKAKFKYEDGGDISIPELNKGGKPCPSGQQWNPYTKKCEAKLEDRTFLNLMRDRKYGLLQAFKHAPKSSYDPKYIQNLKEFTVTASKKNKAKKNKKKTDVFSSDYEKLVEQYDKLKNSPLLANQEKAEALLRQIKEIKLYTPPKNQISFEGDPIENFINKHILDDAMGKASVSAEAITEKDEDEIDNFRHPQAGRYAAEAIVNYFPEWAQYTGIPQTAGLLGANAMGVGHELGTIFGDPRWFDDAYKNNEAPSFLEKAKIILGESGEDIFNNAVGAGVGVLPMNSRDKTNTLLELSNQNMLPDGIVTKDPSKNLYLKKGPNDPGKFKNPYKQKDGGIILDLTKDQIDKYVKGGYVVEEVSDPSIAKLNRFIGGGSLEKLKPGGANKGCPSGTYWNGTKCTKLYTLKNDKKYIDGVANWAMHVDNNDVRKSITSSYNDQIKDYLYTGKWGFDPESGALIRLSKVQPQSVTKVDDKTKASREKEKLAEKNYYADIENKKAYEESIKGAGFDPATFGKAKGTNVITGEPIYASSKEEADRINQEAINQAAIEGHAAVVNNPVFKTASYFTPWGMAIGAMEGAARLAPDVYDFAKDPSWSGAGQIGMDVLQTAPFAGAAIKNAYKINPNAIKTPAGFQNRVFNSNVQLGSFQGKGHLSEKGYNYRTLGDAEIKAIQESKGVFPKTGKAKGGNENVKYWTKGNEKNWYAENPDQQVIRVKENKFNQDKVVNAKDVEVYNHSTGNFEPIIKSNSNTSISGRLKQFFDRPPGPLMLGMPTSSGSNMVKRNMNYYKQLLDSYDGKKMSAANRKFYNDLINTANKQDGMVTEAQVRELDRLKSGNFDFGKRGFNKESLVQVEPKAPKSDFKSEINWSNWNKEIPENVPLMQEYNAIEESTKANGTWMKNPDGSPFQGTPEQFVQQNSENFKKAFGNSKLVNPDGSPTIQYHGSAKKFDTFDESKFQLGDSGYSGKGIYTSPSKTTADSYAVSSAKFHKGDIEPTVYELYGQANNPISSSQLINENKGRDLFNFHRDRNWQGELSPYESLREYDAAISDQLTGVQNIRPWHDAREVVFPTNKQLKSAIGNNGMFDLSNPNIYKALIPTVGVTGLTGMMMNNSNGLPQQKKGGSTNDYIEIDIPEEEIQKYVAQGYIVEPVTKLKKFIS
jgi:hypothetical protein